VSDRPASLFLLSLPRSLSGFAYHLCRHAIGLAAPDWTSDGEILNLDRHVLAGHMREDDSLKYTLPGRDGGRAFARMHGLLDDIVRPRGHCYKDVVQPFAVTAWLAARPVGEMRVLTILPDIPHVAARMAAKRWLYPAAIAPAGLPPLARLVSGLRRAERALSAAPGETLHYEQLVRDSAALRDAIMRLYPGRPIALPDYVSPAFQARRDQLAAARDAIYHEAVELYRGCLAEEVAARDVAMRTDGVRANE
jgi:hypothetical protein